MDEMIGLNVRPVYQLRLQYPMFASLKICHFLLLMSDRITGPTRKPIPY